MVCACAAHFDQTATIGILVHSAIDGLALGAISVSDNSSLELVVFFAIILHKAPAAFGLTSFLMHQGRSSGEVRKHLLWFSLAAPLTALSTYIGFFYLNVALASAGAARLSASSHEGQALLGLCLVFSAGTFLFTIAVHILPEIRPRTASSSTHGSGGGGGGGSGVNSGGGGGGGSGADSALPGVDAHHDHDHDDDDDDRHHSARDAQHSSATDWSLLAALVFGLLAPVGFSAGHSHGH